MFNKTIKEIEKELDTDINLGLNDNQVKINNEKYGKNKLQEGKKTSLFVRFLLQFKDVLIIILIVAAIISILVDSKEWVDSLIIFIVVIVNAILGVLQENKAEKSLEALKKMSMPNCKVIREGKMTIIKSEDITIGDILFLEAGDIIPCDCRIIEANNLTVDESSLTGESLPVEKNNNLINENNVAIADQHNMLFSSCYVNNGNAKCIATKIGMETEIGHIASMLDENKVNTTPLQDKLTEVGKIIGMICIGICIIVFLLEYIGGVGNELFKSFNKVVALESFKSAIALAVAAIPEGLATVVTIVLALGVEKMAKRNAIVKKLPAVETLGSTQIICSDKTGTLTQNKMTVKKVYIDQIKEPKDVNEKEKKLLQYFALCCSAKIEGDKRIGDPTELALLDVNNSYGLDLKDYEILQVLPFDSDRKLMSVLVKNESETLMITKGAFDIILTKSKISKKEQDKYNEINEILASEALRVLVLGIKKISQKEITFDDENDLEILGFVGMIDPSREEVKDAIKLANDAGIRVIMITGDHKITASAIAKDLGIKKENDKVITSLELNELSDEYLSEHIEEYSVYARVAPSDKVRIVKAFQNKNKVVAMTGDGVNDAPALKLADIGCAMGITGTDVSKEASDMILMDDNFNTIVDAVKEGRGIYNNIKKCIKYLLSSNIGEVMTIFVASLITLVSNVNLGIPLLPIHLLWINLITDSLPAFGLGMEKASEEVMKEKPREKNEGFFANKLALHIAIEGICIGSLTLISYLIGDLIFKNVKVGQTMAFLTLSSLQLFHSYNVKSDKSVFSKDTFNNKMLNLAFVVGMLLQFIVIYIPEINDIFKLEALTIIQLLIALGLAFFIVIIMEIYKLIVNKIRK